MNVLSLISLALALCWSPTTGFAPALPLPRSPCSLTFGRPTPTSSIERHMIDASSMVEAIVSSSMQLAETEAWVQPAATALDVFLNFMSLAMLSRVVLSWYPTANLKEAPWIFLVIPTEPLLRAVKGVIPPAFGVDITPVAWLGLFTFVHEILLGQQGLFTMKMKYGI